MSDGYVTVAQCVEGLPLGRCVWELLICGFLAWFLLGAINESTPLAFSFVSTEWAPTEQNVMMMSAALALGNFLAIGFGGWAADRYGRLAVVRPSLLMTVATGMLLQTARTFAQALLARLVLGLVSGGLIGVMPPLIAEMLPARNRGFYLTVWCCGWPAGALFSIVTGCLLPSVDWKTFYTIMIVPAIVLYICTRAEMLLESPRYLYLTGRRDEGYNTLMDMYDKEQLPLPWAVETIAVTCAPPRPTEKGKQLSPNAITMWLAITMFCVSAAAQSMKLWMPTMLVAQQADASNSISLATEDGRFHFASGPNAVSFLSTIHAPYMMVHPNYKVILILAQAYLVQLAGIILFAYMSTWVCRKHMVQWSIVAAAFFTLVALALAESGTLALCGPALGVQLAASSTGLNFLQVFASEHFPTSRRAKTTAFVNFAAQLGNFTIPVFGGLVVQHISATGAVIFFSSLYVVGWAVSHRLPLPVAKERPLHDVDDPVTGKEAARRKRDWLSYQTI